MDEQELFKGLKNGDRKSIEFIYSKYFDSVKYWILNNKGTKDDALDIFQETMETILLKIEKVHTSLGGLILQLSKRKWIDRLRKEKRIDEVRSASLSRQEIDGGVEEDLIEKENAYLKFKTLERTFSELSELCQRLMTMLKEDRSVDEIIQNLSFKSANTVYRRKSACMERWSTLIRQDANYDNIIS